MIFIPSYDFHKTATNLFLREMWTTTYCFCITKYVFTLLQCCSVAYAENFHGGVSFSGIWWSFVCVQFLWRHHL